MKLRPVRSIPLRSFFLGNNNPTNEYPGRKITDRRPRTILIGVLLKGGIKTNRIDKRGKIIVSLRSHSFSEFLNIYIFHKNDKNILRYNQD